jgi:hypothetical protein
VKPIPGGQLIGFHQILNIQCQIVYYCDNPPDRLYMCIEYSSANPLSTYIMYHPVDVHWDVLNDTMS